MADLTAQQELTNKLTAVGIDVGDGSDADLHTGTLKFTNQLYKIFVDADAPTITSLTPETLDAIEAGIQSKLFTPNEDGAKPIEMLDAIVNMDADLKRLDTLLYAVFPDRDSLMQKGYRSLLENQAKSAFEANTGDVAGAFYAITGLSSDAEMKSMIATIGINTTFLTNENIVASVTQLKNSSALIAQIKDISANNPAFQTDVTADTLDNDSPAKRLQDSIKIVETAIEMDSPDGVWGDAERSKLKEFLFDMQGKEKFGAAFTQEELAQLPAETQTLNLMANGGTPTGWEPHKDGDLVQAHDSVQDGIWDVGYRLHLLQRAVLMNEAAQNDTGVAQAQQEIFSFVEAMDYLQQRNVQILSDADLITTAEASQTVETALSVLGPMLNESLIDAGAGLSTDSLEGMLAHMFAGDLLEQRITPIDKDDIDGRFDIKSQSALQGLMLVLSHKRVLNVSDGETAAWQYTPAKGALIASKLKEALNAPADKQPLFIQKMSDAQKDTMKAMIESGQLDTFILSLDHLSKNGQILNHNVINNIGFTSITQEILNTEITRLEDAGNPAAVKLLDTMLYGFTSGVYGINSIVTPGIDGAKGLDPMLDDKGWEASDTDELYSAGQKYDKRLAVFFQKTKDALKGPQAADDAFFLSMMDAFETMPFGNDVQRDLFKDSMRKAFRESENGAEFAQHMHETMDNVNKHGDVTLDSYAASPKLNPNLKDFGTFTSNGVTYGMSDVIQDYNNMHLNAARSFGSGDAELPLAMHGYTTFKDDDGAVYVTAIDRGSMTYNIEKILPREIAMIKTRLDAMYEADTLHHEMTPEQLKHFDTQLSELRSESRAFALIFPKDTMNLGNSYGGFYDHISAPDNAPLGVKSFAENKSKHEAGAKIFSASKTSSTRAPIIAGLSNADADTLVEEFERTSGQPPRAQPTNDDRTDLTALGYSLVDDGKILDADDIELLTRYNGHTTMQIGAVLGASFRLRGVFIEEGAQDGKMLAHYDDDRQMIIVSAAPQDILDHMPAGESSVPGWVVDRYLGPAAGGAKPRAIKPAFDVSAQKDTPPAPKGGLGAEFDASKQRTEPAETTVKDVIENSGIKVKFNRDENDAGPDAASNKTPDAPSVDRPSNSGP